jgi:hypothetical protein
VGSTLALAHPLYYKRLVQLASTIFGTTNAQLEDQPDAFYVFEIIDDMCAGQYADEKRNAGSRSKLPQPLLLMDYVLYRNVCPLGHKS